MSEQTDYKPTKGFRWQDWHGARVQIEVYEGFVLFRPLGKGTEPKVVQEAIKRRGSQDGHGRHEEATALIAKTDDAQGS